MGKGDRRTKKGKMFLGTFGNSRPRKKVKKNENTSAKTEKK